MKLIETQVGRQLIAQNLRMLELDMSDDMIASHDADFDWYPAPWRKGDPLTWKGEYETR